MTTGIVLLLYFGLLFAHAKTLRPINDEADFADPAANFAENGSLGSRTLETQGGFLRVDQHTYYMFPLNLVVLAGWYRLTGESLMSIRLLSFLWNTIFLAEWAALLWLLLRNRSLVLLCTVLLAFDFRIMFAGSFGRYEPMVAALGFGGYVAYLYLRERSLNLAVVVSQACIVAAGITHPNGLMFFVGLLVLTLALDRTRIGFRHVALAAVPYVVGAIGWSAYALQDFEAFRSQLTANSGGRVSLFHPLQAVANEINRYRRAFGLGEHAASHSGPIFLKALALVAYLIGLAGVVGRPALRNKPGIRLLLLLFGVHLLYQTFFDGIKFEYYLVHIIPFYTVFLGIFLFDLFERRAVPAVALGGFVLGLIALQAGGIVLKIRANTFGNNYQPAVQYLLSHARPGELIMGDCNLGFGLGFTPRLVDDMTLGFQSHRTPDYFVMDETYHLNLEARRQTHPQEYRFMACRLSTGFELVYDRNFYQIYRRKPDADTTVATCLQD